MPALKYRTAATDALVGIWTVALTAFIVGTLYFASELLIPLALAVLLTFLLSPVVTRIERWIGRIAAVLVVVTFCEVHALPLGYQLTLALTGSEKRNVEPTPSLLSTVTCPP